MKFTFIRHGQTDANRDLIILGGELDLPMNSEGIQQVKNSITELESIDFDIIISSPLIRTKQTAQIIADYFKKEVIFDERIKERMYGSWSGRPASEREKETGVRSYHDVFLLDYKSFGGESKEDTLVRIADFNNDIKRQYKGKKVLVVSHGGIIRLMHFYFGTKEIGEQLGNASIHKFDL